jgi:hypothetical protein
MRNYLALFGTWNLARAGSLLVLATFTAAGIPVLDQALSRRK